MTSLRVTLSATLVALFFLCVLSPADSQTYPSRIVRIIVPYPPGGPTDVIARIVANGVAPILGQNVIVENRPGGAAGTVGSRAVVTADPDGYTLLVSISGSLTITPSLYKLGYDPLKAFAPIAILTQSPSILTVNSAVPGRTLVEFLAYARSIPGKINLASPSIGTLPHLLGELLQLVADVKLTHVPYRGAAPAITDLLAGQVQVMFNNPSVVLAHLEAGRLRALGVTSESRFAQLPDVPTFAEAGYPQLEAFEWIGLLAPAGTLKPIIDKLSGAVGEALKARDVQEAFRKLGVAGKAVSPQEFGSFMAGETRKWAEVVARAGIKAEEP